MKKFAEFVKAVFSHWLEIVGGAVVSVLFFGLNWKGITNVPAWVYSICTVGGFIAACFHAWLDETKKTDELYKQIEEFIAQSDEKKRKAKHKEILGMALHALSSRLNQIQEIDIYKTTKEQMQAHKAENSRVVLRIVDCLAPLGSGEQALIGLAEPRKEDLFVDGVPDAFIPMACEHQFLTLAIKGKMDAIRARLERL